MTTPRDIRISDAELSELLATMKASDSVELKMTVVSSEQRATIAALPLDPIDAQIRQVFFFDTPDLALYQAGVVVRARRIAGGRGDSVVKLRPVVPGDLDAELRQSPAFNVEVDVLPGWFGICSGSLKGRTSAQDIRDAVGGTIPLRRLFTKEQRAFYREHAPEGLDLDALSVLGPTFVLKGVFTDEGLDRRLVAEYWLYPDGERILELSTKCLPSEAFQVAAEARAYLHGHGISTTGIQETKTRTALDFFSAQLQAEAAVAAAASPAEDQSADPA